MKPKKFWKNTPFIPVKNLKETLAYYREVLGFYEEWTFGNIDGGIRRDEMRMIFCEDPDYVAQINNENYSFVLIWFVENVDGIYEEMKQKQIDFVEEMANKPWGIREFTIRDINGYRIRFSESITNAET